MIKKLFSQLFSRSFKGQAAVEFLTTYGWMFMIVLVVSGGLVYFGFTGGKDNMPSSCQFTSNFECKAFFAFDDGSYGVEIKNVYSKPINITHFICGFPQTDQLVRYSFNDGFFDPGTSRTYYCDSDELQNPSVEISGKDLFKMKIAYNFGESQPIPVVVDGEMIAEGSDDTVLHGAYIAAFAPLNDYDIRWINP